jgi:hypothetical protein
MDNYYRDLKTISLSEYEQELMQTELLPSRKLIQEDLKARFACLGKHGIKNLDDLLVILKTPEKLQTFAKKTGLPHMYLTILKREIASSLPKPVNLIDFTGIKKTTVQKLEKLSLKNTKKLFDFIKTENERDKLSKQTGIPYDEILELTKLTDVSRIKWVGATFARMLVDSPCDTVEKISKADFKALHTILLRINEQKKYFDGKLGQNDLKLCVMAAQKVPMAIEY